MRANFKMLRTMFLVVLMAAFVKCSGVQHLGGVVVEAPVVTAASSQYFQRNFNRLVLAAPVAPVATAPPVFAQTPQAAPFQPSQPIQPVVVRPVQPAQPVQPNVAFAVATANAAAPVATILLPPYPFGFPGYGLFPQGQPSDVDEQTREPEQTQTTTKTTTKVVVKTTTKEPENTTPLPASSDNNFVQALPSNQNVNGFKQYLAPPHQLPLALPQPQPHHHHHHHHPHGHLHLHNIHPEKFKTSVEVVRVPLAYIAPPALPQFHHKHEAIKVVKHIHSFVPARAKLIIRPVSHVNTRSTPVKIVEYKPALLRIETLGQNTRLNQRDIELTTLRPFPRPNYRPPRM